MKASLKEVLAWAEERGCAIGSFNTPAFENLDAIISAAESVGTPVIIAHAQVHEADGVRLEKFGPLMVKAAQEAKVPVCVHLDHGEDPDYLRRAMDMGFTSVMIDASAKPYEENAATTKAVVEEAHARGVDVEGEIGSLGAAEGGAGDGVAVYTDPGLAKRFVADTGIDALAASFGTAHGIYKAKPVLDFERITEIRELTGVPLVMHGGSGVSPEDYRKAIACGVKKINYYSYMARAGGNAVAECIKDGMLFFHVLSVAATNAMREDVLKAMEVFSGRQA